MCIVKSMALKPLKRALPKLFNKALKLVIESINAELLQSHSTSHPHFLNL